MRRYLGWSFAVVLFGVLIAQTAQAQVTADQKAAAEALFDKGLALMKQGEYAQACSYLEQSQAVERGIGTMLYLAECYEKLGRTASAWALFREAASAAAAEGQGERAQAGAQRAAQIEPQLARLAILVPPAAQLPGLEVFRNGVAVSSAVWGVMVPVDPGAQKIDVRAPGHEVWTHTETLPRAGQLSVSIPRLTPAANPEPVATSPEAPTPVAPAAPPAATQPRSKPGSVQRVAAIVTGAVGVVGLGVGSYFGARAASKNSDANKACPMKLCPSKSAEDVQHDAETAATLSNVFVIGGAALVGAGIVLYFTAPRAEAPRVALRGVPGGAELTMSGRF